MLHGNGLNSMDCRHHRHGHLLRKHDGGKYSPHFYDMPRRLRTRKPWSTPHFPRQVKKYLLHSTEKMDKTSHLFHQVSSPYLRNSPLLILFSVAAAVAYFTLLPKDNRLLPCLLLCGRKCSPWTTLTFLLLPEMLALALPSAG